MDKADELHAKKLIAQLQTGATIAAQPSNLYEPKPGEVDNQQSDGVETVEIPGIGTVTKDADISTYTQQGQASKDLGAGGGVNICPQCGKSHPPIQPGQKCPMAPIQTPGGQTIDINPILEKMQVILTSQLEQKSITDITKFSQFIIIEITKLIEGYKE